MPRNIELRLEKIENEIRRIKKEIFSTGSKKRFIRAAGSWKDMDTERLKKNIYTSRKSLSKRRVEF